MTVLLGARVIHLRDVRVGQPGGGLRLGAETGHSLLVTRDLGVEDLHRHPPLERAVEAAVDGCHAAAADLLFNLIPSGQQAVHVTCSHGARSKEPEGYRRSSPRTSAAIGAAAAPPEPPFSMTTATATRGSATGANPMNQA